MQQIILAFILFATPLSATIFHPIDTTKPLSCRFSTQQHNRILIENGRIKKIIFPEDKLYVRVEETSGQVFIQAKNPFQEKIVVSIISQSGVVQDVEIEFANLTSQVIVLRDITLDQQSLQQVHCSPCCYNEDLSLIVGGILQGKIPSGFCSVPITNFCRTIKLGVKAKLVGRLHGCYEDLYIYQVHNARIWQTRLLEKDLSSGGALWVYLQRNCLRPKETVLAIVAARG